MLLKEEQQIALAVSTKLISNINDWVEWEERGGSDNCIQEFTRTTFLAKIRLKSPTRRFCIHSKSGKIGGVFYSSQNKWRISTKILMTISRQMKVNHEVLTHQLRKFDICGRFIKILSNDQPELQKRADRAKQSVLFFPDGANLWAKHPNNCAN